MSAPSSRSNSLTADLLADIESKSGAEVKPPSRKRAPTRVDDAEGASRPAATPTKTRAATAGQATDSVAGAIAAAAAAAAARSGDGPFLETTFFLSPGGWSRPALRRDEYGFVLTAGPLRVRSGRR